MECVSSRNATDLSSTIINHKKKKKVFNIKNYKQNKLRNLKTEKAGLVYYKMYITILEIEMYMIWQ